MLQFKQDDTATELILTLRENESLAIPYYLFVFTHVLSKETVAFIKTVADDQSNYKSRYNQFTINPSVIFLGKQVGEWHYKIYEQGSNSNLNPALSGAVLEYGKMILDRAVDFAFKKYDTQTSFKTYNG